MYIIDIFPFTKTKQKKNSTISYLQTKERFVDLKKFKQKLDKIYKEQCKKKTIQQINT